ncbi:MAG: ATP-binding protein [Desulfobacter sp.]|nr:MAG: ATP-binding protein [Desulfobacter sp.]
MGVEDKKNGFEIEIRDNGKKFNPLEMADPDVDAPLDERDPGGLGIFFVKQLSADVIYLREDNNNVLRLVL